jgi:hypothetical protein
VIWAAYRGDFRPQKDIITMKFNNKTAIEKLVCSGSVLREQKPERIRPPPSYPMTGAEPYF